MPSRRQRQSRLNQARKRSRAVENVFLLPDDERRVLWRCVRQGEALKRTGGWPYLPGEDADAAEARILYDMANADKFEIVTMRGDEVDGVLTLADVPGIEELS